MKFNIWLADRWYNNLDFMDALVLADEYYAEHGDSHTTIVEVSTNKVVNLFQIEQSNRWYTFEELIDLSYYKHISVTDAKRVHS